MYSPPRYYVCSFRSDERQNIQNFDDLELSICLLFLAGKKPCFVNLPVLKALS